MMQVPHPQCMYNNHICRGKYQSLQLLNLYKARGTQPIKFDDERTISAHKIAKRVCVLQLRWLQALGIFYRPQELFTRGET